MVAEAKDQTAGASSQSMAAQDKRSGYAPKVRKPYTITKQRERWTEEEHQRFVEALRLYGRAWRQIEDHVGSKTAIQIRSHAQKFFAKVTRDSSADAEGVSTPIEIPPPRPKKKPLHPYPRKTLDKLNMEVMIPHQPEEMNDDDVSMAQRENYSPTSVLSDLESSAADVHNSRLSPTTCATDAYSANLFTENNHATSTTSSKEDHGFRVPLKISSASVLENKSIVKFELFPQETESTLDSPYNVEPCASIKLFGKTVVVRDNSKQSSEAVESCKLSHHSHINKKQSKINSDDVVKGLTSNTLDSEGNATHPCMQPRTMADIYDHMFALPWYTWYPHPIYPYGSSTAFENVYKDEDIKEEEDQKESFMVDGKESGKGFVPYKRCLAERDDKSCSMYLQKAYVYS